MKRFGISALCLFLALTPAWAGSAIYTRLPQFIGHSSLIVSGWIRSSQGERQQFAEGGEQIVTRHRFEVERVLYDATGRIGAGQEIEYLTSGGHLEGSDEEVVTVGGTRHHGAGDRVLLFVPERPWGGERAPPLHEVLIRRGPDARAYLTEARAVLADVSPDGFVRATAPDGRQLTLAEVTGEVPSADELLTRLASVISLIKHTPEGRCRVTPLRHVRNRDGDWRSRDAEEPAACAFTSDPCGWLTDHTLRAPADPGAYLAARDALVMTPAYGEAIEAMRRLHGDLGRSEDGWMLMARHDPHLARHQLIYVVYSDPRACQASYLTATAVNGGAYTISRGRGALAGCRAPEFPAVGDTADEYEPHARTLDAHSSAAETIFFLRSDSEVCGVALPGGIEPPWLTALLAGSFLEIPWPR